MKYSPHDYQKYVTNFILNHPVAAVFLDMGLGKTAITLSAIFDLTRWINTQLADTHSLAFLNAMKALFSELTGVLNIVTGEQEVEIPEEVKALVEERTAARAAKNFARADEIRDQLAAMGVVLEDGKDGVKILMKQ